MNELWTFEEIENRNRVMNMGYKLKGNTIVSPGKFEGEHFACVLLWEDCLTGNFSQDYGDLFEIELSYRKMIELGLQECLKGDRQEYFAHLWNDDNGFVYLDVSTAPINYTLWERYLSVPDDDYDGDY